MRQPSRDRDRYQSQNLQRTGLSIIHNPNIPTGNSTIKSLNFDTMAGNRPLLSSANNPFQSVYANQSAYQQPLSAYQPPQSAYRYQSNDELGLLPYADHMQESQVPYDNQKVFQRYMDEILARVVRNMAREVVKEFTDYLVSSILNKRHQEKPESETDPYKYLTLRLISRFVEKEVVIVAKEAIQETSLDYFQNLQYMQVMKDVLIPNTVRFVVYEALDEIIMEKYLETVIGNLTAELAGPLVSHQYELIVAEKESASLDQAMQNYVHRMMGDVLIEHLLLMMGDQQNYDLPPEQRQHINLQQDQDQAIQPPEEPPEQDRPPSYHSDFGSPMKKK